MIRNIEAHESSQCNKKRGRKKRLPINKTFLSKKLKNAPRKKKKKQQQQQHRQQHDVQTRNMLRNI
jgi:hypothetical protein